MARAGDATYALVETPKANGVHRVEEVVEIPWSSQSNPLESANWLTVVAISWIDRLIARGAKAPLTEDDVWPLPQSDTAAVLHAEFRKHWDVERTKRAPALWYTIYRTFRVRIWYSISLYVVSGALMLVQPILIKSMLQFLQQPDDLPIATSVGLSNGYALATVLSVVTIASVSIGDYGQYLANYLGVNAKLVLMDTVFKKILCMSGYATKSLTTGDIVTMASVDADRMFFGFLMGYWTFISPLTLLAVFVMLGTELGAIVAVVGGSIMLAFVTMGFKTGEKVGRLRADVLAVQAERVKLTNEILQGIRVVKLYAWEASLESQLADIRAQELVLLRKYQATRIFNTVALMLAPLVSLAACLMVYVALGNQLTTPAAFTALAYMNIARQPCTVFSSSVMGLTEALASCRRITTFLLADEVDLLLPSADDDGTDTTNLTPVIEIDQGDFSWAASNRSVAASAATADKTLHDAVLAMAAVTRPLTLRSIQVHIAPQSLTIVIGAVGSGKSSLIHAILGEIHQVRGQRHVHHAHFSYVNQDAWIQHATLKQNILFDSPYDEAVYHEVLSACQLESDLSMLPDGDATEIGERGINLSGGQKARVSLARALYCPNANVYLLDDPLSALDVHVANAVFEMGIQGLLQHKTTVLVLNSHYHLLPKADRVLVMADGTIVGDGTYDDIKHAFPHLMHVANHATETEGIADNDVAKVPVESAGQVDAESSKNPPTLTPPPKLAIRGQLIGHEDRQKGTVTASTYNLYFTSSGRNGCVVASFIALFYTASQTLVSLLDWFMSYWSNDPTLNTSTSTGWWYIFLAVASVLTVYGRSLHVLVVAIACSRALHAKIFHAVVHAPVPTFFDVTPVGRVLNRFSSDLDQVDAILPYFGMMVLQFLFQFFAVVVVCMVTTPWILVLYLPLVGLFFRLQRFYNASSSELKRMEGTSRSPVVTKVSEAIHGLSTIRAFSRTGRFLQNQRAALDRHIRFTFTLSMSNRWFQLRLDWVASLVIVGVAFVSIWTKSSIGLTAAGLSLTYSSQLSFFLSKVAIFSNMVENTMTAVERLGHFNSLASEDAATAMAGKPAVVLITPPGSWPTQGEITFTNYSMRYREHLDLVLNDVSFTVKGGEKVGICGRTGSGKSSLMAALFRMVPSATGTITLDGVDIASISVRTLRSRMTIIPQDPVLFSGSLRFNLDPSNTCSDDELWTALERVHLDEFVGSLEFAVSEKGGNVSVGQRQLVCIARALLRKSKVVVLDEATANIDLETDRLIQQMIQDGFHGVTRLIIAHRLETILDSDRILVLDAGRVKEFDAPATLLANKDSAFAQLAQHAHVQVS
ncbi:hypothetical protein H310_14932 [Aphanomyces invadans]|uniref:ATP-binding Cassette (ABC) Superfamily n=1 Tax=Aphanomyces invadans TaxID=157072 RepID=A0A024T850_9STRA|nr:hypothetical protein H310_14932 [Aphanomyces invadans]ETV90240.1 hypothetical protein H310_14932 [Aphanomyces invadans]|eukprot:XP_008881130.1 hypothetical protein H310_14932 [Aphanomyces invadans]